MRSLRRSGIPGSSHHFEKRPNKEGGTLAFVMAEAMVTLWLATFFLESTGHRGSTRPTHPLGMGGALVTQAQRAFREETDWQDVTDVHL